MAVAGFSSSPTDGVALLSFVVAKRLLSESFLLSASSALSAALTGDCSMGAGVASLTFVGVGDENGLELNYIYFYGLHLIFVPRNRHK